MSIIARQSTALELSIGPVLDADGVAVTGGVVGDFKIKKTTGNFAALNGSATLTHVSAGTYDLVLTTSDTDTVGLCSIAIDDTTNACAPIYLQVIEEAIYDAMYAASANAFAGSAGSTTLGAGAITATVVATGAIDADALATDAVEEIRNAITGGAYDLDTDANGRIRIVDGTGAGELDTASGVVLARLANAVAHGGSTATLELGSTSTWALKVASSGGTAALIQSTDAGSSGGLEISGNSYGLKLTGTVTADLLLGGTETIGGDIFTAASLAQFFSLDSGTTYASAVAGSVVKEIADNAGGSSLTVGDIADAVWDEATSGHTTAGSFGKALSDILVDTGTTLDGRIPAALVGGRMDCSVGAMAANVMTANAAASDFGAELQALITGGAYALNTDASGYIRIVDGTGTGEINTSSGSVSVFDFTTAAKALLQTEAEDALVVHRLDELLNADSDIDGLTPPTVGSVFHELMSKTTGSFTFDQTTDSLEALADALVAIDDFVDTEVGTINGNVTTLTTRLTSTRAGYLDNLAGSDLNSIYSLLNTVSNSVGVVYTDTQAILADTNELQTDWTNGGRLDLLLDAILDDTGTSGVVVNAAGLATDAVQEIRNAITGYAGPLNLDASGNVKISDGTGANQLALTSGLIDGITGTLNTLDQLDTAQDAQHAATYSRLGAPAGASMSADILLLDRILRADQYIDTGTTPWERVLIQAGTGNLATGTRLLEQEILDTAGADLTDEETIVGNLVRVV